MADWMMLSVCSANRAKIHQSSVQNDGSGNDGMLNLSDSKNVRKWLSHQVEQNPDALMDYWVLIQRELYKDLLDGKNAFARNLADKRKHCNEAVTLSIQGLKIGDKQQFNDSMDLLFSEDPGGYAGEVERFIVRHWTVRPEPDLPPFCCWKDECIASYLSERSGKRNDWSEHFIEDRRRSLGLLKVPAYVVYEWRRGTDGSRGKPQIDKKLRKNPKLDRDAFNWICRQLTYDVFCDAFGSRTDEFTQFAMQFLRFPISELLKSQLTQQLESIREESTKDRIPLPESYTSPEANPGT